MEDFEQVMGMFELNNTGFALFSPMEVYYANLGKTKNQAAFGALEKICSDSRFKHPEPSEGSGLFSVHCCFNHSCVPNAAVVTDLQSTSAEVSEKPLHLT